MRTSTDSNIQLYVCFAIQCFQFSLLQLFVGERQFRDFQPEVYFREGNDLRD